MPPLLLALLAAMARVASLPGWVYGPMCLLYVPLRAAGWERGLRPWQDWLGGFVFWLLTFSFLTEVHWLFPLAPAAALACWWVVEGALYRGLRRRLPPSWAAPLAVCTVEFARCLFPMGGLPWAQLPLGLGSNAAALFLARATGESGLVVLTAFAGGWIYALARRQGYAELIAAPLLWLAAAAAAALGPAPRTEGTLPPLRCLAVQPNLSVSDKNGGLSEQDFLRLEAEANRNALDACPQPDLLVWAETMFPLLITREDAQGLITRPSRLGGQLQSYPAGRVLEEQHRLAEVIGRQLGPQAQFLTGAHWYEPAPDPDTPSPRQSEAVVFAPDGRLLAHSGKTELVPFGERLPLLGRFPGGRAVALWIYRQFGLLPDFAMPDAAQVLRFPRDGQECVLGAPICWENMFEAVFRRQAGLGAQAFVVLSNEAWYGTREEMDQMVAATRFRAAETGRAVLRATNSGWSVLVTADGRLVAQIPRGQAGWLAVDLPRVAGDTTTLYRMGGWAFLPLAAAAGLLLALFGALRPRLDPPPGARKRAAPLP